jgi:hypothetical protein
MIGSLPATRLAPLDYRCALDAALASLGEAPALVICRAPELEGELRQRAPWAGLAAGIWVEPQAAGWRTDMGTFARRLLPGASLAIVASRPLARLLPERRGWAGGALGLQPGGIWRLRAALAGAGLALRADHGFHSPAAIALGVLARRAERAGRPDLSDRLYFAARLRYRASGAQAALCAVALLIAVKEADL